MFYECILLLSLIVCLFIFFIMFYSKNLIIPTKLFQEDNDIKIIIRRHTTDTKPKIKTYHCNVKPIDDNNATVTAKKIIKDSDSDDSDSD